MLVILFPDGVIGNTTDFGSVILRSSRSRGIFQLFKKLLIHQEFFLLADAVRTSPGTSQRRFRPNPKISIEIGWRFRQESEIVPFV